MRNRNTGIVRIFKLATAAELITPRPRRRPHRLLRRYRVRLLNQVSLVCATFQRRPLTQAAALRRCHRHRSHRLHQRHHRRPASLALRRKIARATRGFATLALVITASWFTATITNTDCATPDILKAGVNHLIKHSFGVVLNDFHCRQC